MHDAMICWLAQSQIASSKFQWKCRCRLARSTEAMSVPKRRCGRCTVACSETAKGFLPPLSGWAWLGASVKLGPAHMSGNDCRFWSVIACDHLQCSSLRPHAAGELSLVTSGVFFSQLRISAACAAATRVGERKACMYLITTLNSDPPAPVRKCTQTPPCGRAAARRSFHPPRDPFTTAKAVRQPSLGEYI